MKRKFEYYLSAYWHGTREMGGPFKISKTGFKEWTVEWDMS